LKKSPPTTASYPISWLASLFAADSKYDSFSVVDDGILLMNGLIRKNIPYLAISTGIAVERGLFWDVLAIHLENGKIIRIGGINKKQSRRLKAGLDKATQHYLVEFYQRLVPEIQTAFKQAQVLFPIKLAIF
jgi:DNA helicase-4